MVELASPALPVIVFLAAFATETLASPVWMPQFLSGGSGRNIRHLPCVSRRTGEQGTCMFAYTCMKANGTHLGTCIDRFYFGSCCKLAPEQDPLLENDVNYPPLSNKVTDNDPLQHPSISTIVDAVKLGTSISSSIRPTTQTAFPSTTDKLYVPIATSVTKPNKTDNFLEATRKPVTVTTQRAPTTTPQYLLSTFQVVHDNNKPTTPSKAEATTRPTTVTTTRTTTTTRKTTQTTTKKVPVKTTTKKPPTKKPVAKPTTKPTVKPVKATTTKPLVTKKPTTTSPVYKPVSTITNKPTTVRPTTTSKVTTTTTTAKTPSITPAILSTTSEVVFTKPGSDFLTTNFSAFSTFRPDLSPTTKSPLITGPGLTTFTYLPERVTTEPSNEVTTEKVSSVVNEVEEEQSNLIFQQAGTPAPSGTSTTTETSSGTTKGPWVEISPVRPNASISEEVTTAQVSSTTKQTTTTTTTTTTATDETTTESPITTTLSEFASFGGLNVSDYTQVCGRRLYPESRVVGGEKATFGKWPWQISLRQWRTSTYLHKCGAALLNENWAITAAHCVENVPPSDLLLRLGEHDLSREDEPYGYQERRVQIVASHPQFDPRNFEYDLALLRFYEPVKFQPNVIPICVPEDSNNFVGQDAHVTGWGRLYEDGPLPSVLQEVSVPVINNSICENMYRSAGYIEHIPDIFICAGWKKGGFDSCEGDSGGPMVIQRADKRWLLAGVISWGIGCAEPNQPGVYTRISQFRDWINQILQF